MGYSCNSEAVGGAFLDPCVSVKSCGGLWVKGGATNPSGFGFFHGVSKFREGLRRLELWVRIFSLPRHDRPPSAAEPEADMFNARDDRDCREWGDGGRESFPGMNLISPAVGVGQTGNGPQQIGRHTPPRPVPIGGGGVVFPPYWMPCTGREVTR